MALTGRPPEISQFSPSFITYFPTVPARTGDAANTARAQSSRRAASRGNAGFPIAEYRHHGAERPKIRCVKFHRDDSFRSNMRTTGVGRLERFSETVNDFPSVPSAYSAVVVTAVFPCDVRTVSWTTSRTALPSSTQAPLTVLGSPGLERTPMNQFSGQTSERDRWL